MICICDYRTPPSVLDALNKDFEIVQLPPDPSLPAQICGHSDLLVFRLENFLITRNSYYSVAKSEINNICKKSGLELIISESKSGDKYPKDCGLCAVVSGKNIICRCASTDYTIIELAERLGYKILNVNQGYAKCSCAVLRDGAIITSDSGIASVTRKNGIDTLLIKHGNIRLPGYDYGFIGGSTGLCGNALYFCGDLSRHPDCKQIKTFASLHGTKCVLLGNEMLYDVGSLIFI